MHEICRYSYLIQHLKPDLWAASNDAFRQKPVAANTEFDNSQYEKL